MGFDRKMGMVGRQFILLVACAALAGCDFAVKSAYEVTPGRGAIVADEPRAVLVARNVLAAGGTAADAAVALYFTLAVTYPASAGLGGQGVCVVREPSVTYGEKPRAEALDFTSPPASIRGGSGQVPVGIPANARGMFALHARYGRLLWSQLILPAENLARFGAPVSRALGAELQKGAATLKANPASRAVFRHRSGAPLREGENLVQFDLASTLGRIRARGPGDLYSGELARKLVNGAREAGGALAIEDLRAFRPVWRKAIEGKLGRFLGHYTVYFPPREIEGAVIASRLWHLLYEQGRYGKASAGSRGALVVKTVAEVNEKLAGAGTGTKISDLADPAVSGFAVMDGVGGAVACAVTMNGRFGTGRMIRGTGVVAAAAPGGFHDGRRVLSPILVASGSTDTAIAAVTPSGNGAATSAMITVALKALSEDISLKAALAATRAHPGPGTSVYVEGGKWPVGSSSAIGNVSLGRVNAIVCPDGLPRRPDTCVYAADPRGAGYAVDAEP